MLEMPKEAFQGILKGWEPRCLRQVRKELK